MKNEGTMPDLILARAALALGAALACAPAFAAGTDLAPAVEKILRWTSQEERAEAAKALIKAGPDAVEPLLRAATSPNRVRAVQYVIEKIGPKAYPELLRLLTDPALASRAGFQLFNIMGPEGARYAPDLLACLRTNPGAKGYCGQSLVRAMSPKAKGQVELLTEALSDPAEEVRVYAATALGQIGPKAKKAAAALGSALSDRSPAVRVSAALALSQLGRSARDADEALKAAAAADPNEQVKRYCEQALKELHGS